MSDLQTIISAEHLPLKQFAELLDRWESYLKSEHAETTQAAYSKGLGLFRVWLQERGSDLQNVTPPDVREWRDELRESYAVQTVNLRLSAVRRFYAWLIEEGAPILNPAANVRGASRRGKSRRHKRDELSASEVLAVLDTCEESELGKRDRGILALMAYCALRTIEVQRADLGDLATRDGRSVLWVRGKGRAEADDFVVLPPAADEALRSWLIERGREKGPLFVSLSRQNPGDRLSTRAIRGMVKGRFHLAGVVNGSKTTHSLRHSAISNAIRNGAEPLQVQAMARHQSFDTTLGYYHEVSRTESPAEDLIDYGVS
jgi:site-specific recombinase XerD